jgi:hypothetical protein
LHGEISSLWAYNDGIVIGRRARRNGITTESRVRVDTYGGPFLTLVRLSGEIMRIGAPKDILIPKKT